MAEVACEVVQAEQIAQIPFDQVPEGVKHEALKALFTPAYVRIPELCENQAEVLAALQKVAWSAGINLVVTGSNDTEAHARILNPEKTVVLLSKLKTRFEAHRERHQELQWADVQKALEADPTLLWSLNEMEKEGHRPDLYLEDENAYYFGTTSKESPTSARNLVFDAAAQVGAESSAGNAVELSKAMGIDLMPEDHYRILQTLGEFDTQSWSWLKTPEEIRSTGRALYGFRVDELVNVNQYQVIRHNQAGAFRGSLRVPKVK